MALYVYMPSAPSVEDQGSKYVVTGSPATTEWKNSVILGLYRTDAIRDLKDKADGDTYDNDGDTYDNGAVHLANAPRMSAAGPDRLAGRKARQHGLAMSPKLPLRVRGPPASTPARARPAAGD